MSSLRSSTSMLTDFLCCRLSQINGPSTSGLQDQKADGGGVVGGRPRFSRSSYASNSLRTLFFMYLACRVSVPGCPEGSKHSYIHRVLNRRTNYLKPSPKNWQRLLSKVNSMLEIGAPRKARISKWHPCVAFPALGTNGKSSSWLSGLLQRNHYTYRWWN